MRSFALTLDLALGFGDVRFGELGGFSELASSSSSDSTIFLLLDFDPSYEGKPKVLIRILHGKSAHLS